MPLYLLLCPAAGAIAAGNAVVIKPSEVASETENLLDLLLPKFLDDVSVTFTSGNYYKNHQ